jgi:hypothetical protein
LREALAAGDSDFIGRDDDRPARRAPRRGKGRSKAAAALWRFRLGRPGKIFVVCAAVAAISVPVNALYFQDGRHPAPLFGFSSFSAGKRVATLPPPEDAPLPPPRPASVAPAPAVAAPAKPAVKAPVVKAEAARAEKGGDAIGALLATAVPAPAAADKADRQVIFAQRALAKLGYGVRPDGVFGAATREALEKFERSIGASGKGDLTPKLLRQLATRSGLPAQ